MLRIRALCGVGVGLLAFGCKKSAPNVEPAGSGSSSSSAARPADTQVAAPPAWTAKSHPIELSCGDNPLPLAPPQATAKPSADRALAHGDAVASCHDQASVDTACACLVSSIATWGASYRLAGPATCKALPGAHADAQLVQLDDEPSDPDAKTGGSALVLLARRGATWSAVSVVDAGGDIDLTQTPKLTQSIALLAFEPHPIAAGSLYWIETRSETHESDMGERELEGGVLGTVCTIPNDAHAAAFCHAPIKLGTWSYTFTPAKGSCEVAKLATFSASFDGTGLTLHLEHGSDSEGSSGRYRF